MKEIVIKNRRNNKYNDEYYCEITDEMDKYLTDGFKQVGFSSYIHICGPGEIAFRYPGATRGHILYDKNNIITEIKFYEDTAINSKNHPIGCYTKDVANVIDKFIGSKIIFKD